MKINCSHDKREIESYLRKNTFLHIYSIGDLDEFFWSHTTWYTIKVGKNIKGIVLVYTGLKLPTVLAITDDNLNYMLDLIRSIINLLPRRFYAHISPGLASVLKIDYRLEPRGSYYKMALKDKSVINNIDISQVKTISKSDLKEILKLFKESYPENCFEPVMLDTYQYYCIRKQKKLICIAGVHAYSRRYKVAALGNITTHPNYRGKGYGKSATAKLCKSLLKTVDHIGLNVKTDNIPAVNCYKNMGFEPIGLFEEYMAESRT